MMRRWCLLLIVGLMVFPQTVSAERCRAIGVVADEEIDESHALSLTLMYDGKEVDAANAAIPPILHVGTSVDLCFQSSRDGYVSLWSHDADNNVPVRILPNEYVRAEDDELGIAVKAGERRCFSELTAGRDISLKVNRPLGQAQVYLHFSEARDEQIAPDDFPSIGNNTVDLAASCERTEGAGNGRNMDELYASKTLNYEVVE